ncbi:hypothetical protein [Christiangramia salexigens]|uniref:hypothetical protein n=1 Tax=Christiangramia salexigens TaxID=1913577 RepID=UPI0012EC39AF|nr:hypothetical protein [Christiangramia salexigens]
MGETLLYFLTFGIIVLGCVIWVLLIRDNSKQQELITKYSRDIKNIENSRKRPLS